MEGGWGSARWCVARVGLQERCICVRGCVCSICSGCDVCSIGVLLPGVGLSCAAEGAQLADGW